MKEINLTKMVGQAINDYDMLREGERVLVAISGGADSTAAICLLTKRMERIPVRYEFHPVTIDPYNGQDESMNADLEALRVFLRVRTGLELEVVKMPLIEYLMENDREEIDKRNICFKCAQIKRSTLIKKASEEGYTKIVLGHHKDDVTETTLMNLFYQRELSTMIPRLSLFDGKIDIIRPLVYLEKHQILEYIKDIEAPVVGERCPAKMVKHDLRREKVRELVKMLSKEFPRMKTNLFAAMRNPKSDYLLSKNFNPKNHGMNKRP